MNDIQEAIKKLCRDIQNSIDAGDKLRMSQAVCYLVLADRLNPGAEPEEAEPEEAEPEKTEGVRLHCSKCKHFSKHLSCWPCNSCNPLHKNWEAATND